MIQAEMDVVEHMLASLTTCALQSRVAPSNEQVAHHFETRLQESWTPHYAGVCHSNLQAPRARGSEGRVDSGIRRSSYRRVELNGPKELM